MSQFLLCLFVVIVTACECNKVTFHSSNGDLDVLSIYLSDSPYCNVTGKILMTTIVMQPVDFRLRIVCTSRITPEFSIYTPSHGADLEIDDSCVDVIWLVYIYHRGDIKALIEKTAIIARARAILYISPPQDLSRTFMTHIYPTQVAAFPNTRERLDLPSQYIRKKSNDDISIPIALLPSWKVPIIFRKSLLLGVSHATLLNDLVPWKFSVTNFVCLFVIMFGWLVLFRYSTNIQLSIHMLTIMFPTIAFLFCKGAYMILELIALIGPPDSETLSALYGIKSLVGPSLFVSECFLFLLLASWCIRPSFTEPFNEFCWHIFHPPLILDTTVAGGREYFCMFPLVSPYTRSSAYSSGCFVCPLHTSSQTPLSRVERIPTPMLLLRGYTCYIHGIYIKSSLKRSKGIARGYSRVVGYTCVGW
eukprot:GHVR01024987.1.p1 GENE.GHVR01024987.1~~GHVR01024987.1.p1  ORF type:complete len:419 (+),score=25.65 GHVR01024987.1:27-1283(+)